MTQSKAPRRTQAAAKAAEPDARKARLKSAAEVAKLLGAGRNTVQGWIDAGCPTVSKPATPGDGDKYVLDMAEVVKWRIATEVAAARKAAARPSDPGDDEGVADDLLKDPEKRMKVARLAVALLNDQKEVVLTDDVQSLWERSYGLIRQSVMALPNRVIRLVPGLGVDETKAFHRKTSAACADALEEASRAVAAFIAQARKDAADAAR